MTVTEHNKQQKQDQETLANFAGISVMFAILIILFALTTPGIASNDNRSNQDDSELEATQVALVADEATEEVVVTDEATEIATEEVVVTEEATEEVVVTDEATEIATEEVVVTEEATEEVVVTEEADESASNSEAEITYDAESIANGETLFVTCSACHGPDGTGIVGLGKDLVAGEFTLNTPDDELVEFINTGRPIWDSANTTMIDMPARGGNPTLTDEDIYDIVAYLRTLAAENNSDDANATEDDTASTTDSSNESVSTSEAEVTYDAESIANGEALFVTCTACHGSDGRGITGLGKDLIDGEFTLMTSDEELIEFINTGRPIWDPANTTMIDMPARGGNPTLTDEDIYDIVAYIRSLQSP